MNKFKVRKIFKNRIKNKCKFNKLNYNQMIQLTLKLFKIKQKSFMKKNKKIKKFKNKLQ